MTLCHKEVTTASLDEAQIHICKKITYHRIQISTLFLIGAALLKTSYSSSPEKALSCGCCHVWNSFP